MDGPVGASPKMGRLALADTVGEDGGPQNSITTGRITGRRSSVFLK